MAAQTPSNLCTMVAQSKITRNKRSKAHLQAGEREWLAKLADRYPSADNSSSGQRVIRNPACHRPPAVRLLQRCSTSRRIRETPCMGHGRRTSTQARSCSGGEPVPTKQKPPRERSDKRPNGSPVSVAEMGTFRLRLLRCSRWSMIFSLATILPSFPPAALPCNKTNGRLNSDSAETGN